MSVTDRAARVMSATGEQRFAAAMLVDAREACRRGCPESCEWLSRRGLDYLLVCAGDRPDVDELVQRLMPTNNLQLQLGLFDMHRMGAG